VFNDFLASTLMQQRSLLASVSVASALALGGCATSWTVDSQVRSFSALPAAVPAGATYRFERLPSQQARPDAQADLEAMAAPALAAAGLRRDDAAPRYSVQVGAQVRLELSPWADPWFASPGPGWGWGVGYGRGWHGSLWYGGGFGPAFLPPADTWYDREVSVVLRDLPGNQVVYETHARHHGPYGDSRAVLPAMFRAALQGFPRPPEGERRVDVQVGGQDRPAAPPPR